MRIALDARSIFAQQPRAVSKTLVQLYRHLAEVRPDWRVLAYHRSHKDRPGLADMADWPQEFLEPRQIEMPGDRLDAWIRWRLPMAAWRDGAEVLHCPGQHYPKWMPVPTVVTIHDLTALDLPDHLPFLERHRLHQSLQVASRRAVAMTCPSNYIRNRLAQETDARPDQIHVIPWGADDLDGGLIDAETESCVLNKYRVTSPFVLHLGATQNHKNTRRLIEAWAYLRRRTRRQWRLLVLGLDATAQRDLLKNCQLEGVQSSVLLQGFANGEETRILMSAAEVLAHPSLAEGFGGPVLEAFAAGTAVLTGNRTSLPEIAGDAALLVDPEDRLDMTRGLNRLIQQPNLRSSLAQRGSARLQHFRWHASAEAFGRLFDSVIA